MNEQLKQHEVVELKALVKQRDKLVEEYEKGWKKTDKEWVVTNYITPKKSLELVCTTWWKEIGKNVVRWLKIFTVLIKSSKRRR